MLIARTEKASVFKMKRGIFSGKQFTSNKLEIQKLGACSHCHVEFPVDSLPALKRYRIKIDAAGKHSGNELVEGRFPLALSHALNAVKALSASKQPSLEATGT
ncbi:hypothetical protein NK8_83570 (plasmid) [Caballeronia sp. NK8]|uniref:hypothetical protein n=1 Tax=Caballeronia sp. NK8 TaxID=140098 RepID=UPI001BB608A3|nr:hypothetical protein [Caballeronia sp. NK8]BCQ30166.1 hypothetical protein NK8_83570 [Caballeronia sp. NK8]